MSKLFVGNLSFDTTENDLQDTFSAHGSVVQVDIPQDRMTNKPRGFGFVTMSSKQEADAAVTALNGTDLHGRALTVNEARPREERGGGGGGRGGYGNNRGGSSNGGGRSYSGSRY
jgi:cold-inducible RNA-binding protein